jgi:hypothetical protein
VLQHVDEAVGELMQRGGPTPLGAGRRRHGDETIGVVTERGEHPGVPPDLVEACLRGGGFSEQERPVNPRFLLPACSAPGQGVGSRIGLRRRRRRAAHAVQVGEERMALLGNGSVRVWWVVCRVRAPAPVCKGARGSMAHDGRNVVRDLTWLTTAAQEMATELLGR